MIELKPCPFCGPGGSIVELYKEEDTYKCWTVGCGRCGTHSGKVNARMCAGDDSAARERVLRLWNARPLEDAKDARIAELEADDATNLAFLQELDALIGIPEKKPQSISCNIVDGIERAKQRIAELEGDKRRLDWLESQIEDCAWDRKSWALQANLPQIVSLAPGNKKPFTTWHSLRSAIDAAMEVPQP